MVRQVKHRHLTITTKTSGGSVALVGRLIKRWCTGVEAGHAAMP
jgi:hypothetical protein